MSPKRGTDVHESGCSRHLLSVSTDEEPLEELAAEVLDLIGKLGLPEETIDEIIDSISTEEVAIRLDLQLLRAGFWDPVWDQPPPTG